MPDNLVVAALLLVAGPLIGAVAASHPSLFPVWSASRTEQLRLAAAHRVAWTMLNVGFFTATVSTASGIAVLAVALDDGTARAAVIGAVAVLYAIAGSLWCAVVAIRAASTPFIADATATGRSAELADSVLGVALTALFGAFTMLATASLVGLGLTLGVAGGIALPVAVAAATISAATLAVYVRTGDVLPAVVYLPTILIGIALLAGWR